MRVSRLPVRASDVRDELAVRTVWARELAYRGYYEPAGRETKARMEKALAIMLEGKQRDPIELVVGTNGKIEVYDGRHRLAAAIELDRPIKVRFSRGTAHTGEGAGMVHRFI